MPGQLSYVVFHTILILHHLFYAVKNLLSLHFVPAFWNILICCANGTLRPCQRARLMPYVNCFVQILNFRRISEEITNRAESVRRSDIRRADLDDLYDPKIFGMPKKILTDIARSICTEES